MAPDRSSSTPASTTAAGVLFDPDMPVTPPRGDGNDRVRPQVEIRPSARRRKTIAAFYEGDKIVVLMPARLPPDVQRERAEELVDRLLRRRTRNTASDTALEARSAALADRYLGGVRPRSIRWVNNQQRRWGSCTVATREIRISSRLQLVPEWVLDTVIVHELAHLLEASHSPRFKQLANRAPRVAEADAFLAGYSLGMASANWPEGHP